MFNLIPNKIYINSWNNFSRAFLIWQNLGYKNLIIFDDKTELKKFLKIWDFLKYEKYTILEREESFLGFLNWNSWIFFTTSELFNLPWFNEYEESKNSIKLAINYKINIDDTIKKLIDFGYKHSKTLSSNSTYHKDWDILNIKPFHGSNNYKISFWWDEIDEILVQNKDSFNVEKFWTLTIHNLNFVWNNNTIVNNLTNFSNKFKDLKTFFVSMDFFDEFQKLNEILNPIILAETSFNNSTDLEIKELKIPNLEELSNFLKNNSQKIKIYTKNTKTITNFIEYNSIFNTGIEIIENTSNTTLESFSTPVLKVICDDILWEIFVKKRSRKSIAKNLDLMLEIKTNDYIVHIDHWVGIFKWIILKEFNWIKREYIEIGYRENDKLFVPISELHRVSKYIGNDEPKLTRLSTNEWQKIIKSTEVEVEKIARELLDIYAKRTISTWFPFNTFPLEEEEFKNSFKFAHTLDQLNSIKEILEDMNQSKPMDRLLVGDVGFGKTEVASNAIYRAFLNKKQVAFISPLVILAYEHYETLSKRFAQFGLKVEVLTRVTTQKEEKTILQKLLKWEINCIIWTHKLLSPDIKFNNLGLVIIDEEHKFWVIDKEKLNKMRTNLDILSLSATPIPRSLNFALNWIKDISTISTPPPSKKPIKTFVSKWSEEIILKAIKDEFDRWWQVIFIHNRISTIESVKRNLEKLIGKHAKITITHGRMNWVEVEDRIIDFKNNKYNILLSTTVIENGVNFLTANTIIIDGADNFGLSQLHQLRWRVGRKDIEWYCYLIYRNENLADDTKKRLITIVNNTHLGAWFEIALRDLEIRWAWDILGIKQSGKSKETWISLYLRLLENKIEELKTWTVSKNINCQIELNISYYIEDSFFNSESDKMHFFRNIESIETIEDLDYTYKTFIESIDRIPEELNNLFLILKIRITLSKYDCQSLKKIWQSYVFDFDKNLRIEKIKNFLDIFDKNDNFVLITPHRIKVETINYKNDLDFLKKLFEANK